KKSDSGKRILVVLSKDHKVITIQDSQEETSSKKKKLSIDESNYDSDLNSKDSQEETKVKKYKSCRV
ncbi:3162_t:CDS:2, partial [Racocetra fulgida]